VLPAAAAVRSFAGMQVLYLEGDPAGLKRVSGTLTRMAVAHEVVRPGSPLPRDLSYFQAVILSDFARAHLHALEELLVRAVRSSSLGLLMLGGRRSFGRGGYARSELGGLLPVTMLEGDDRVAQPGGMLVEPVGRHPILRGIDWTRPTMITGYNRVQPRPSTTTVIGARAVEMLPDGLKLCDTRVPLLVVKEADDLAGRRAAFATDLGARWCGGLADWGRRRLALGEDEEVGEDYATLLINLVRWVAGEDTLRRPLPTWEELAELPSLEIQPTLRVAEE
jgi:uncharacterized membrane protein